MMILEINQKYKLVNYSTLTPSIRSKFFGEFKKALILSLMAGSVIVYILTADDKSDRVAKICGYFTNSLFQVNVVTLQNKNKDLNLDEYRVNYILNAAQQEHPNNYIIVLKDTSVTVASPDTIADFVSAAIQDNNWDLFYLCEWMDRCDQFSNVKNIEGITVAQTQSPNGIQTLLISPLARDMLLGVKQYRAPAPNNLSKTELSTKLNQLVLARCLRANCMSPNLFEFDLGLAQNSRDYMKANQCVIPQGNSYQQAPAALTPTTNSTSGWWWLIIIAVLVVILLAACCWYYKYSVAPNAATNNAAYRVAPVGG